MRFRVTPGMTIASLVWRHPELDSGSHSSKSETSQKQNQADEIPGHARNDDCFFGLASP